MDTDLQTEGLGRGISPETPKVSIGMPVYNGEAFLRRALDCLLEQTFSDFELIISDNASTDATPSICEGYAARDSRIVLFRQKENMGPTWNFNFVLSKARADYFMWAACDDLWDKNCLAQYVSILDNNDTANLVFCNYHTYNHITGAKDRYYVMPSVSGSSKTRLLIRIMDSTPSLIYGLFRMHFLRTHVRQLEQYDYYDVYLGYLTSLHGRILVVPDFLYYAGIKELVRKPYSLTGSKLECKSFVIASAKLILSSFKGADRAILLGVFARFALALSWSLRRRPS